MVVGKGKTEGQDKLVSQSPIGIYLQRGSRNHMTDSPFLGQILGKQGLWMDDRNGFELTVNEIKYYLLP